MASAAAQAAYVALLAYWGALRTCCKENALGLKIQAIARQIDTSAKEIMT